jgi:flagellar biosynthetic protein FlhB
MSSDRTEKATPKRRDEARKRGQMARSTEVSNLFALTGGFAVISLMGPKMFSAFEESMRQTFRSLASPELATGGLSTALNDAMGTLLALLVPVFAVAAAMAVASSVVQNRPRLGMSGLKPDIKRLNPMKGFKKLASPHSLVELVKSIAKLSIVSGVVFLTVWPSRNDLASMGALQPSQQAGFIGGLVLNLAWRVLGVLVVMAIADVGWSRYSHEKSLKMSKEEIKQEHKQQDMSPELRGRIRSKARGMARARMLGNVKKADVIVTNPTHFAVALAYRAGQNAPRVLAKGADLLALRIRELGREHDIAIVENPPLARQLYSDVEVGQEVPTQMFALVAEVLAYVWRTNRGRKYAWT